jgi:hypothetical protein
MGDGLNLDYRNVYQGARSAFPPFGAPHWHGQVDPVRLAMRLVADSPFDRELTQVRIYRGQPDSAGRGVMCSGVSRGSRGGRKGV